MVKDESSGSAKSANQRRGLWRPLAVIAALALAGCSAGNNNDPAAEARVNLFPDKSAKPAPQRQGPREIPVLVDCVQNPRGWGGIAAMVDESDPSKAGVTYILGTYDSSVPAAPDGQKAVMDGVTVVNEGNHRLSVKPANDLGDSPAKLKVFDTSQPEELAQFVVDGASITVETTYIPATKEARGGVALIATIICANTTARS